MEQRAQAGRGDVARRHTCENRPQPHLLDHVVRGDAEIDAGTAMAPEILQRVPIARERRRIVGDVRAGLDQDSEISARMPA